MNSPNQRSPISCSPIMSSLISYHLKTTKKRILNPVLVIDSAETKLAHEPKKNTPMMEQYLSIKESYKDAILFYRMGDFYEMFLEDAAKAASILGIALTSRNKNADDPIPMCGVPFRAADNYIAKLIGNGCKVAVCEQMEDAALTKELVKRQVVRVITPGMILNEELLDKGSNNFLLALSKIRDVAAIAYLDISTGTFKTTQVESRQSKNTDRTH